LQLFDVDKDSGLVPALGVLSVEFFAFCCKTILKVIKFIQTIIVPFFYGIYQSNRGGLALLAAGVIACWVLVFESVSITPQETTVYWFFRRSGAWSLGHLRGLLTITNSGGEIKEPT